MLKTRLIPCLLLQNGLLVRSETFSVHQVVGYPVNEVRRFNEWNVDELIYLDITRDGDYDLGRSDHKVVELSGALDILDAIARTCFVPLTFGGRIRSIEDMRARFRRGADKVSINSEAFRHPELLREASQQFGNQALVVSIDAKMTPAGVYEVVIDGGRRSTGVDPITWALEAEQAGAGEILLNSVDRDGTGDGFDLELIAGVAAAVTVPVVALGGAGTYEDLVDAVEAGASAVAAANIFHFKELSDRNAKRAMSRGGLNVRL